MLILKTKKGGGEGMELRIKAKLPLVSDIKEVVAFIKLIEKEYSCNCTLLELEIG